MIILYFLVISISISNASHNPTYSSYYRGACPPNPPAPTNGYYACTTEKCTAHCNAGYMFKNVNTTSMPMYCWSSYWIFDWTWDKTAECVLSPTTTSSPTLPSGLHNVAYALYYRADCKSDPPAPTNGFQSCTAEKCTAHCNSGYVFKNLITTSMPMYCWSSYWIFDWTWDKTAECVIPSTITPSATVSSGLHNVAYAAYYRAGCNVDPPAPTNGYQSCTAEKCTAHCNPGHAFINLGTTSMPMYCWNSLWYFDWTSYTANCVLPSHGLSSTTTTTTLKPNISVNVHNPAYASYYRGECKSDPSPPTNGYQSCTTEKCTAHCNSDHVFPKLTTSIPMYCWNATWYFDWTWDTTSKCIPSSETATSTPTIGSHNPAYAGYYKGACRSDPLPPTNGYQSCTTEKCTAHCNSGHVFPTLSTSIPMYCWNATWYFDWTWDTTSKCIPSSETATSTPTIGSHNAAYAGYYKGACKSDPLPPTNGYQSCTTEKCTAHCNSGHVFPKLSTSIPMYCWNATWYFDWTWDTTSKCIPSSETATSTPTIGSHNPSYAGYYKGACKSDPLPPTNGYQSCTTEKCTAHCNSGHVFPKLSTSIPMYCWNATWYFDWTWDTTSKCIPSSETATSTPTIGSHNPSYAGYYKGACKSDPPPPTNGYQSCTTEKCTAHCNSGHVFPKLSTSIPMYCWNATWYFDWTWHTTSKCIPSSETATSTPTIGSHNPAYAGYYKGACKSDPSPPTNGYQSCTTEKCTAHCNSGHVFPTLSTSIPMYCWNATWYFDWTWDTTSKCIPSSETATSTPTIGSHNPAYAGYYKGACKTDPPPPTNGYQSCTTEKCTAHCNSGHVFPTLSTSIPMYCWNATWYFDWTWDTTSKCIPSSETATSTPTIGSHNPAYAGYYKGACKTDPPPPTNGYQSCTTEKCTAHCNSGHVFPKLSTSIPMYCWNATWYFDWTWDITSKCIPSSETATSTPTIGSHNPAYAGYYKGACKTDPPPPTNGYQSCTTEKCTAHCNSGHVFPKLSTSIPMYCWNATWYFDWTWDITSKCIPSSETATSTPTIGSHNPAYAGYYKGACKSDPSPPTNGYQSCTTEKCTAHCNSGHVFPTLSTSIPMYCWNATWYFDWTWDTTSKCIPSSETATSTPTIGSHNPAYAGYYKGACKSDPSPPTNGYQSCTAEKCTAHCNSGHVFSKFGTTSMPMYCWNATWYFDWTFDTTSKCIPSSETATSTPTIGLHNSAYAGYYKGACKSDPSPPTNGYQLCTAEKCTAHCNSGHVFSKFGTTSMPMYCWNATWYFDWTFDTTSICAITATTTCSTPTAVTCNANQVFKQVTDTAGCVANTCECKACLPIDRSKPLLPGLFREIKNDGCCDYEELTCRAELCPAPTVCKPHAVSKEIKSVDQCCPAYKCIARNGCIAAKTFGNAQIDELSKEICEKTCSVLGYSHYTKFDGGVFDFTGACSYYLVQNDKFEVIGINAGTGFPTYIISIIIKTNEHLIKLEQNRVIAVDDKDVITLPYTVSGIQIRSISSMFISVQLPNGFSVKWDGVFRTYITAPPSLAGQTKGLCGIFANDEDLLTRDNTSENPNYELIENWKADDRCTEPSTNINKNPCEVITARNAIAVDYCEYLKSNIFFGCHQQIDHETYYKNCVLDVCSCQGDLRACACSMIAAYADECRLANMTIDWRKKVPECGLRCPNGQSYKICSNNCQRTCRDISMKENCNEECIEDCSCPTGQALDDNGFCVPIENCDCYLNEEVYGAGQFFIKSGQEICTCMNANWECRKAQPTEIDEYRTKDPSKCDAGKNLKYTSCKSLKQQTCQNMHHKSLQSGIETCQPGCDCKEDFVLDTLSNKCIPKFECSCYHGGRSYDEHDQVQRDCNTCTCKAGQWECTQRKCSVGCSAWGDSHFKTFDGKLYDFQGQCDYILAKGAINELGSFQVSMANVACGTLGVSCSKSITVSITSGKERETIKLIRDQIPQRRTHKNLSMIDVGLFIIVEAVGMGVLVHWDKGTRVYVTVDEQWKNKVQGLCGNYNGDDVDDFQKPDGVIEATPIAFSRSWKISLFCPEIRELRDTCELKPERKSWAIKQCQHLKSAVFETCHSKVPVDAYFEKCTFDACACDEGGDCECLCTAIAAYAQECNNMGVPINWRTRNLCPTQCDDFTHYKPCISTCPYEHCDTMTSSNLFCKKDSCIEGCSPKLCPYNHVFINASFEQCVPKDSCKSVCLQINDKIYYEGDVIKQDKCQICRCRGGRQICTDEPCKQPATKCSTPVPLTCNQHEDVQTVKDGAGCVEFVCKCRKCEPINYLRKLPPGQFRLVKFNGCCTYEELICRPEFCPGPSDCAPNEIANEIDSDECCPTYNCEPREGCTVTTMIGGVQKEEVFGVGKVWSDGPCTYCTCLLDPTGGYQSNCTTRNCPSHSDGPNLAFMTDGGNAE